jgi:diguanylate cyclase (GGDEF)-like protein
MKVHPAESTLVPPSAVQFLPTPADFLQIKRRGPADLAVIRSAPFWIPPAIPTMVALFLLMVFATLMWVYILRRRVRQQTAALRKASETTQAIHDLSSAMLQVTVRRQFETEVSVRGSNEVADLVVGFNTMLSELQRRDRAMREAEARLQHLTLIDDLTGLPNRRLLTDRLSQSLAKARRENRKVALLYIDLDGFKLINDSLGHGAGDALLGQVAQRLKSRFRQSDTLARIGGDEFTLILDNVQTWADGDKAAVSVLEVLKEPFELEGHSIKMTASIGISIFPDHGNEGGQLLQQADCAMFAAKRNGKNRIVQFGDGLGSAARERLTLEGELRRAIENNEITIHYQPEFDLASNKIVRFEALARWFHPKLGTIPPLNFIPIAEESGLIVPLGAYVMERACADAVTWQSRAGRPIQVAVNVSSVQFARDSFLEEVEEALHRTGLRPSLLQLEITESATLTGVERAADLIRRLTGKGIGVAMDDFGTGYSCLSYLPRLSFDALKLDRSFVSELVVREETRAFVESILSMARNLHMKVIVEGIETREQLELMKALGTNEAQGYLLGRPTPNPMEQLGWGSDIAARAKELEAVR